DERGLRVARIGRTRKRRPPCGRLASRAGKPEGGEEWGTRVRFAQAGRLCSMAFLSYMALLLGVASQAILSLSPPSGRGRRAGRSSSCSMRRGRRGWRMRQRSRHSALQAERSIVLAGGMIKSCSTWELKVVSAAAALRLQEQPAAKLFRKQEKSLT